MTQPTTAFLNLENQNFMNMITYRKSGAGVKTPVWFAQAGDTLYVMTSPNTGKVKRLRNNPKVQVEPSNRGGTPLGPSEWAVGRVLEGAEANQANALLSKKYGWQKKLFDIVGVLFKAQRVFLAFRPAPG